MTRLIPLVAALCLALTVAQAAGPAASSYDQQGMELCNASKFDQAIQVFNEGLKAHPQDAVLYDLRGRAYFAKGQNAQALADHNQALTLNPRLAEAYKNRALVYYTLENFHEAAENLKQAQALGYRVDSDFMSLVTRKAAAKR